MKKYNNGCMNSVDYQSVASVCSDANEDLNEDNLC